VSDQLQVVEVGDSWPADWLRSSLSLGGEIASAVHALNSSDPRGQYFVIAPAGASPVRLGHPEQGGLTNASHADERLSTYIDHLKRLDVRTLFVEDDLRRKGDPALSQFKSDWFEVAGRVVHWRDITVISSADAVNAIRAGASGYPLNAFIAATQPTNEDTVLPQRIAASLLSVIVSAFDGESFLMWEPEPHNVE
jgi:hypothetical protein